MERRQFLRFSAFAAAAISVPFLHSCNGEHVDNATITPQFLSRLFNEKQIIQAGKEYRNNKPEEDDENKLISLLSDNSAIAKSSDEKAIHQYLDQKVRDDFAKGNTVLVKGWVLSQTEARQCALYSIVKS